MSPDAQRHVRAVSPLAFPDSGQGDQLLRRSQRHSQLCTAIAQMLRVVVVVAAPAGSGKNTPLGAIGFVGRDKLVYFRANDPSKSIAPDAFVKLGTPFAEDAASWKTWERGAPDVAFEILSPSDSGETWTLDEKIARYSELGVRELVVFDVDDPPGHRLRVWDRIDGDFVERIVEGERTPCITLGLDMAVGPVVVDEHADAQYPACLRLVRANQQIVPTTTEARMAAEQARRDADQALLEQEAAEAAAAEKSMTGAQSQRAEAQARGEAKAKLAELEAQRARDRASR